ncbi:hypothetical protein [Rhodococcus sp. NPDC006774]|uniref:hypothetical protein n=1 Tax=Rhodococcus sp. NPDC006774 TaxID=3157186 RepID=UPI0033C13889
MSDLTSAETRRAISERAAPYFVRIDIPKELTQPETWVVEAAAENTEACAHFCAQALGDRNVNDETFSNIQVRVWHRPLTSESASLVFDRTCLPWAVPEVLAEFATQQNHSALPPITSEAMEHQREIGGPFDSEHALLVAVNDHLMSPRREGNGE